MFENHPASFHFQIGFIVLQQRPIAPVFVVAKIAVMLHDYWCWLIAIRARVSGASKGLEISENVFEVSSSSRKAARSKAIVP